MNNSYINDSVLTLENEENKLIEKKSTYKYTKRILDIVISIIGFVLLLPIFGIISLCIKIDSKGPVLFKHKRIGKNGKELYIYKFRTMVENAEDMIKNFSPEQMKEFKENYKLKNDSRITSVGKFLRKTSLDELPQLLNIIKGELSIVGPRPVIEEELEKYGENKKKFVSVTPGLTGYWAANGRSCTSYEQRMKLELYYVDNVSFKLDTKIILKTALIVLKRQGAI